MEAPRDGSLNRRQSHSIQAGNSGRKAFRFAKQSGDGAVYDLHADDYGLQCQCKGFVAHGHCKHVETTQAAGKLFNLLAS
jgi:hypothetical protein